jgi:hypothetical protein
MNRASIFTPKDASPGIAPHHENRCVLALVAIDRVLGDHLQHLAILVAQRTHRMDVTAAQAVSDAVESRAGANQEGFASRRDGHALSRRGFEDR